MKYTGTSPEGELLHNYCIKHEEFHAVFYIATTPYQIMPGGYVTV